MKNPNYGPFIEIVRLVLVLNPTGQTLFEHTMSVLKFAQSFGLQESISLSCGQ